LRRRDKILEQGKLPKGFAESEKFARRGEAEGDSAGEAFEVLNAAKFLADFTADDGLLKEVGDSCEASFDGIGIEERAKHPGAEEACAHTGDGGIEGGDERGGAGGFGFFGKDWGEEFEIADGDGIEDEGILLFIETDAIEVLEGFDAGGVVAASGVFAEIVDNGASGAKGLWTFVESERCEFGDAELLAEDALGVVTVEDPVFDAGFDAACSVQ